MDSQVETGSTNTRMRLIIPELSFVVLIGVSGSGKSTFARKHFKPTEILSSDYCRGLVSDDENSQAATKEAFELLHFIARKRLAAGKLTVVDATNVQPESRKPLVEIAREFHCLPVAFVLDVPERVAHDRNKTRADRAFGPHVIRQQAQQLHRSLRGLEREGFRHVHVLKSPEEIEAAKMGVSAARERLNRLKAGPRPEEIRQARSEFGATPTLFEKVVRRTKALSARDEEALLRDRKSGDEDKKTAER